MKKRILTSLVAVILTVLCVSCGSSGSYVEENFYKMDTVISVKLGGECDDELFTECENIAEDIENKFSRTIESSEISLFNVSESEIEISDDVAEVIKIALDVSEKTNGAYDITVAPLVTLWNITGENPDVPDEAYINACLEKMGYEKLSLDGNLLTKSDSDIKIDLGGIAKGYALGKTVEMLRENGVEYGTVSYGGNVGLVGKKPDGEKWKVSIRSPYEDAATIGYMSLDSGFVSVSGDYERYFEKDGVRYHHILDTETGYPVDNGVHSVAVWCEDATLADALSTALFSLGFEKGNELYESGAYEFEALFITDNGTEMTNGMKDIFTETK